MWKSGKKAESTKKKESTALWKNAAVFPREKKREKISTCVSNFSTGNVEKGMEILAECGELVQKYPGLEEEAEALIRMLAPFMGE